MILFIVLPFICGLLANLGTKSDSERRENTIGCAGLGLLVGMILSVFVFQIGEVGVSDKIAVSYSIDKLANGAFAASDDHGTYTVITSDGVMTVSYPDFSTNKSPQYAGQDIALLLKHDRRTPKAWTFFGAEDDWEIVLPQGGPITYPTAVLTR